MYVSMLRPSDESMMRHGVILPKHVAIGGEMGSDMRFENHFEFSHSPISSADMIDSTGELPSPNEANCLR